MWVLLPGPDLVVEEAHGEQVVGPGHPVGHGQVPEGVPQQQHVGPLPELREGGGEQQSPLTLVEGVDQGTFEAPQNALSPRGQRWCVLGHASTKGAQLVSYIGELTEREGMDMEHFRVHLDSTPLRRT